MQAADAKPKLIYFSLRGRGEPLRIALSAAVGVDGWDIEDVNYPSMKAGAGTVDFPFGQAPILEHNGVKFAQMDACLRYIGREFDMYGSSNVEQTSIDMILAGVEDLRVAYTTELCYKHSFSAEAKANFHASTIASESSGGQSARCV